LVATLARLHATVVRVPVRELVALAAELELLLSRPVVRIARVAVLELETSALGIVLAVAGRPRCRRIARVEVQEVETSGLGIVLAVAQEVEISALVTAPVVEVPEPQVVLAAAALELPLGLLVERALGQPVVVAIVSVVINLRWAAAAVRSVVVVEIPLAPVATGAVRAWVAAASAGAAAAAVVAVEGAAVEGAEDERPVDERKSYENNITYYDFDKILPDCFCDNWFWVSRACLASGAETRCECSIAATAKAIQHTERGSRQSRSGGGIIRCRSPNGDPRTRQQGYRQLRRLGR
jgi:hypothetical protein